MAVHSSREADTGTLREPSFCYICLSTNARCFQEPSTEYPTAAHSPAETHDRELTAASPPLFSALTYALGQAN